MLFFIFNISCLQLYQSPLLEVMQFKFISATSKKQTDKLKKHTATQRTRHTLYTPLASMARKGKFRNNLKKRLLLEK